MELISLKGFRLFCEEKLKSMENEDKREKENYLDAMKRELSISPNLVPDLIDAPRIEFPDENLIFNEVIFKVKKPINLNDPYVLLYFYDMKSPNLNQHVWRKNSKGDLISYEGTLEGLKNKPFLIPIDKFAEMFSRPWQSSLQSSNPLSLGGRIF